MRHFSAENAYFGAELLPVTRFIIILISVTGGDVQNKKRRRMSMNNTNRFKSKIDWWMYLLFFCWFALNLWSVMKLLVDGGLGAIIMTVCFTPVTLLVFIPMWRNTYYEIGEDGLLIRGGLGKGRTIAYDRITSVCRTRNPVSSPALSMDRVEIRYVYKSGKASDIAIISPLDREEFFKRLKEKNNDIDVSDDIKPMSRGNKTVLRVSFIITGVVIIGAAALILVGMRDPVVEVSDGRIRIGGMYGLIVELSEVTSVTLADKTMNEIYGGESVMRTNGYGGFGQTNKGHFQSATYGDHMLFVQAETAPTIHIERRFTDIFISFHESEKTVRLYYEIAEGMPGVVPDR